MLCYFFIGIIGKRYGWIPTEKDIDPKVIDSYPQVASYINERINITEMEMIYGVVERDEEINAISFISQDEPEYEETEEYEKLIIL